MERRKQGNIMLIIIRQKAVYSICLILSFATQKISNKSSQFVDNYFKISNKCRIILIQIVSGKSKQTCGHFLVVKQYKYVLSTNKKSFFPKFVETIFCQSVNRNVFYAQNSVWYKKYFRTVAKKCFSEYWSPECSCFNIILPSV